MKASDDNGAGPAAGAEPPPPAAAPKRKPHQTWAPALLAAVIVLGLWGPNLIRPPPPAWTVYISKKGQTRRVKLADRTLLRLNGATAIRIVFDNRGRRAAFDGGEAEFNVAASDQPLVLSVGDREIRTQASDFDLRRYGRIGAVGAQLTVRRGQLQIERAMGRERETTLTLGPGDRLDWLDGQPTPAPRRVDADNAFAWEDHRLVYANTPLREVVADLNRYVDRPIAIGQAAVGDLRFTGVLTLDTEDRMLKRIQAVLPVKAQTLPAEIVLKAR